MVHGDLPHIQRLPKCAEASPTDQIFQIGPGEALRAAGEGVQVHIFGQRHFPGVDADNPPPSALVGDADIRSEEHTSELQSLMRNTYAVFCMKKKLKYHTQLELIIHTI